MKVSVEVDEDTLAQLIEFTGESKKGPAIMKAASDFLRQKRLLKFVDDARAGKFANAFDEDYHPDQNERLGEHDL